MGIPSADTGVYGSMEARSYSVRNWTDVNDYDTVLPLFLPKWSHLAYNSGMILCQPPDSAGGA